MNLFIGILIGILKGALIVFLLGLMLGGGACMVLSLESGRGEDLLIFGGISLTVILISGWLTWLLGRSFLRKKPPTLPGPPDAP